VDQVRKDFVANVSHELKTPLTVLRGFLETMQQDDEVPPTWVPFLQLMEQQTLRMNDIVTDLLLLSRIEMDERLSVAEPVNVQQLLTKIVTNNQPLSEKTGHQISLQVDDAICLLGQEKILTWLFSNLIVNAIKHTPPGCNIYINSFSKPAGDVIISVRDTGEGIAPRHLSRLTERFYRIDSSRTRDSGGTGLGLAIVKQALLQHDGQLTISSELGRGSSFNCEFPHQRLVV
jgi:two-component system phosphate regulon sensor histidine kinase PhoR